VAKLSRSELLNQNKLNGALYGVNGSQRTSPKAGRLPHGGYSLKMAASKPTTHEDQIFSNLQQQRQVAQLDNDKQDEPFLLNKNHKRTFLNARP